MPNLVNSQQSLPYRALTEMDLNTLIVRINEALGAGYVMHGSLQTNTKLALAGSGQSETMFVQLVINPAVVPTTRTLTGRKVSLYEGVVGRDFCAEISRMIEEENWVLCGGPQIYVKGNNYRLIQPLIQD